MINVIELEFQADMTGAFDETRVSGKTIRKAIEAISEVVEAIFD